jgi:cysteine desulfurase
VAVDEAGVDLLSLAGHKFHGPLGAAALYVRRRTRLVPLVHGGHQERSRRAGTENLAAIAGLGVARSARAPAGPATSARLTRSGERLLGGGLRSACGAALNADVARRLRRS